MRIDVMQCCIAIGTIRPRYDARLDRLPFVRVSEGLGNRTEDDAVPP